jgi:hypothetical protein
VLCCAVLCCAVPELVLQLLNLPAHGAAPAVPLPLARSKGNATALTLLQHADALLQARTWTKAMPEILSKVPKVFFMMESMTRDNGRYTQHTAELEMTYQTCSQVGAGYMLQCIAG